MSPISDLSVENMLIILIAITLSFLAIAAHFFRGGYLLPAAIVLFLPFLLLITERWAARVVQGALFVAALEWIRTTTAITQERLTFGQPYLRMVVILGAVIIITLLSAASFYLPAISRRYKLK